MRRDEVRVFKALSDPNRIRIMKMMLQRELCLCEVREVLNLSSSTVSKHLSILRDAGLVIDSKDGKWVNFQVNNKSCDPLVRSAIEMVKGSFSDDETVRTDLKKVRSVDRNKICGI